MELAKTIGVGVSTFNRPKHIELFKQQIAKHTPEDVVKFIAFDVTGKGVAAMKNECLRALKDCDYLFLMDDDCVPVHDNWIEYFIGAHKASGQHHFMYLKETAMIKKQMIGHNIYEEPEGKLVYTIDSYNNSAGCFMFLTKEVIQKVGAFDESFGRYGFEHSNYSKRIHVAGLTPMGENLCPAGAGSFIYSLDLDNHLQFNRQVNHAPSIPPSEAIACIKAAQKVYQQPIENIYIPL
jgi:hypothetical protein